MHLGLTDKIAFIAASSDGLGKSVAMELAAEGATIIICGRNKEKLEIVREEIAKISNGEVLAISGDLSVEKDIQNMVSITLKRFGKIDILVTNTGGPPAGKFEDLPAEYWDQAYQNLLVSATRLIRGFLPGMKKQSWGRIISITSQAVKQPVDNLIFIQFNACICGGFNENTGQRIRPI